MNSLWYVHDCGVKIKGKGSSHCMSIFLVLPYLFSPSQEEELAIKRAVEVDGMLLA